MPAATSFTFLREFRNFLSLQTMWVGRPLLGVLHLLEELEKGQVVVQVGAS